MRITRSPTRLTSALTVDGDLDFLTLYQAKRLANPATGEALKKGYAGIVNADVKSNAAIVESKLSLTRGTQALYDKIATDIATHADLFTGLHGVIIVRKASDQVVNNSTTLVNDDDLVIAVGANDVWLIHAFLYGSSPSATPDQDYLFAVPSGGAMSSFPMTDDIAPDLGQNILAERKISRTTNAEAINSFYLYVGGGTAGNVQLQWAQNAATAEDTKMLTNSFLLAVRIA